MTTVQELVAQRDAIDVQIAELRKTEISGAVKQIQDLITKYDLTQKDIFGQKSAKAPAKATIKVSAKYRDPSTGNEWSGRGLEPKWLAGKDRAQFAIKK